MSYLDRGATRERVRKLLRQWSLADRVQGRVANHSRPDSERSVRFARLRQWGRRVRSRSAPPARDARRQHARCQGEWENRKTSSWSLTLQPTRPPTLAGHYRSITTFRSEVWS